MDFKSHEEVVLPPDEAAKKRAREKARTQHPSPGVREFHIPAGEAQTRRAAASASSASSASSQVPVREVQLSARDSNVGDAAASLNARDAESEAAERAKIEPRILNAGLRLLHHASRQGSPGGRLIRSSQLSGSREEAGSARQAAEQTPQAVKQAVRQAVDRAVEEAVRQAPQSAKPRPKVNVERVEAIQFPEDSIAEVAFLQKPPPVDTAPPPPPPLEIDSKEFAREHQPEPEPPEIDSREFAAELGRPKKTKTVRIDSKEFAAQLELPEKPKTVHIDSKEFAAQLELPEKPKTIYIDSKEFAAQLELPQEPVRAPPGEARPEKKRPAPEPVQISSRETSQGIHRPAPEPKPVRIDTRPVAGAKHVPKPEPVAVAKKAPQPEPVAVAKKAPQPEPVVVAELGPADLVWEPPESDDDPATPAKKAGGKKRGSFHQRPYRDFIIAYDGVFIGHFRSRKRITNRTAFQQVARQMHSTTTGFDVRKLQLYRPVRIEVEIPDSLEEISDGSFMWFSDRRPRAGDSS